MDIFFWKPFDRLVHHILEFDLPNCVRRVSASSVGNRGNWVGYAIAVEKDGASQVQLVTSLADLDGVILDTEKTITDAEVTALKDQLKVEIRERYEDIGATKDLERDNKKSGLAQRILSDMVAYQMLYDNISSVDSERFSRVIEVIESKVGNKSEKTIRDLDRTNLETIRNDLVFHPSIPSVGETGRISAPHSLLVSAVDKLYRTAARMKEGRMKLKTRPVLRGLERDIKDCIKQFKNL